MAKKEKVQAGKDTKHKESFLHSKTFKAFMAKLYGWGASIVIVGALFKIQHWPGAGLMLTVGLSTEALIFFISAFDTQKEFDWAKVYPELISDEAPEHEEVKKSVSAEIEKMLEEAKIEQSMVTRLGEGMNKLTDTIDSLKDISNAAVATNDYTSKVRVATENVSKASDSYEKAAQTMMGLSEASSASTPYFEQISTAASTLSELNDNYKKEVEETNKHISMLNQFQGNFTEAMGKLGDLTENSTNYFEQIKSAATNLSSLNAVYEMEISETGKRREVLEKYHDSLSNLLENLMEAGSASTALKENFNKLNTNLASLNNIYGNMLNAMTLRQM